MLRLTALAIVLVLSVAPPESGRAAVPAAPAQSLPVVGADQMIEPLRVDQLDPGERITFAGLPPGGPEARKFLYTRGFLRFCRLVVSGKLPPLSLPRLPARENWDRQYLSQQERVDILDVALGMRIEARIVGRRPALPELVSMVPDPEGRLPRVSADGVIGPLEFRQLTPQERKTFDAIASDAAEARRFLYTRGYLRFCQLVVDGKLAPLGLPRLPARENWNRSHLSAFEQTQVLDLALGLKLDARLLTRP